MSYAIIRNENHKMNAVPLMERHNERKNKNYSNKDIDSSRSHLNYHLKEIQSLHTNRNLRGYEQDSS